MRGPEHPSSVGLRLYYHMPMLLVTVDPEPEEVRCKRTDAHVWQKAAPLHT